MEARLLSCDSDGLGDMVRDIKIVGLDGADYLGLCCATGVGLDGLSEEDGYHSHDDDKAGEAPGDREEDMKTCPRTPLRTRGIVQQRDLKMMRMITSRRYF